LPAQQREELNRMLQEGLRPADILARLGEAGKGLSEAMLSTWKNSAYRSWLKNQERVEARRMLRALAGELARDGRGGETREAGVELAAQQILEVLANFEPASLGKALKGDVASYTRLVKAVVSLSDSGLKLERYRAEVAARKAAIEHELGEARTAGLSPEVANRIQEQLNLL